VKSCSICSCHLVRTHWKIVSKRSAKDCYTKRVGQVYP